MKKTLVISLLLSFIMFISVSAQESKGINDSIEIKNLQGKISQCLDSIVKNGIYTIDGRGYKYYRFSRGVFVPHSGQINGEFAASLDDSTDIGQIGSLNRISFRCHNGKILFNYFDYDGEPYSEKTMEQLLFAIQEYW